MKILPAPLRGRPRAIRALGVTAVVLLVSSSLAACDLLIGIEDLQRAPVDEEGIRCETPADCPETGNPCFLRACTSAGICELREAEPGYVTQDPTPGDCSRQVCIANQPTAELDPADVSSDGNPCTVESCSAEGVPEQSNAAVGEVCPDEAGVCDGNGACTPCVTADHCDAGQTCVNAMCTGEGCDDDLVGGNETDVDCGGAECPPCLDDATCNIGADCESGVCTSSGGRESHCQAPTCTDGVRNGNETDVDCGGTCPGCALGETCAEHTDCSLAYCTCPNDVCSCATPECDDGFQNGSEIDIDCGPLCEGTCTVGRACLGNEWCQSRVCDGGTCAAPTCTDGVVNGYEDKVDCCSPEIGGDTCETMTSCPECPSG